MRTGGLHNFGPGRQKRTRFLKLARAPQFGLRAAENGRTKLHRKCGTPHKVADFQCKWNGVCSKAKQAASIPNIIKGKRFAGRESNLAANQIRTLHEPLGLKKSTIKKCKVLGPLRAKQ